VEAVSGFFCEYAPPGHRYCPSWRCDCFEHPEKKFNMDPRWEWVEDARFGSADVTYVKGRCRHLDVVPVEAAADALAVALGEDDGARSVVAHLCLTCDLQLP
jgi:hypothetical protein